MLRVLGIATVVLCALALWPLQSPAATLSQAQKETLGRQVTAAQQAGNPASVLRGLSPVVAKLTDEQYAEANAYLLGQQAPALDKLLGDARLALVEQGLSEAAAAPQGRELLISVEALFAKVRELTQAVDSHPALSDPLPAPDNLDEYEKLLWSLHVTQNKLAAAQRIARYLAALPLRNSRVNPKSFTAGQRAAMATDMPALVKELDRRRQELEEREMELRVQRLDMAELLVTNSQSTARERFIAAYALGLDGSVLSDFFRARQADPKRRYIRQSLTDPELPRSIAAVVKRGQETGGDTVHKAYLLHAGLHWWLRGRYGVGTQAGGLLKSELASSSPAAQFPLYMPQQPPKPTDPLARGDAVPIVDRRHHYVWAVEYRPIVESSGFGSTQKGFSPVRQFISNFDMRVTSITHLAYFY